MIMKAVLLMIAGLAATASGMTSSMGGTFSAALSGANEVTDPGEVCCCAAGAALCARETGAGVRGAREVLLRRSVNILALAPPSLLISAHTSASTAPVNNGPDAFDVQGMAHITLQDQQVCYDIVLTGERRWRVCVST
jgi:hypothetical protein